MLCCGINPRGVDNKIKCNNNKKKYTPILYSIFSFFYDKRPLGVGNYIT